MPKRIAEIQNLISSALTAMPGVFSTVQWGGRAYKVGTPKKFKLLAHVYLNREGDAVEVGFKLERARARNVVEEFDWISPHSFRTLAPSGWLNATVRTKGQCRIIAKLLIESHAMHPPPEQAQSRTARNRKRDSGGDGGVVRRLAAIVREKRAAGWSPDQDDDFAD